MAERMAETDVIDLPMSRQDIADYLGLTIKTISRMLRQLETAAAISVVKHRRIILINWTLLSQRLMLDGRQHFERQDRTAILKRSRFQLRCETGQTLRRPRRQDSPDARRPLRFCPSHAAFAVDDVSSLRRPLWRRAQDQAFLTPRSVSLSCLRATDLAREPARHRSMSSRAILQALPSGFPQHGCPQHLGERQRRARLAHLRRLRPTPHRHRAAALCRRSTGA